jgi:DNA-binding GntR family transcriptional regulator
MRSVFAELRLAFHVVDDPRRLHEPYLARNKELLETLEAGRRDDAERLLAQYLDDSREGLVDVYGRRVAEGERPDG